MKTRLIQLSIVTVFCAVALLWNGSIPQNMQQGWVSSAHAIIGRPLTPLSYAGVARRTTARAYAYGAAAGAYAAPVVVTPACVQAVDAYGRVYTRCY